MTRTLKELRRDLKLGCTLQSSTTPALFEAGAGVLAPGQPGLFENHRSRLTTFRPGGGMTAAHVNEIRNAPKANPRR